MDGQEAFAVLDDPPTLDHAGRQILKSFWPDCLSGIIPAVISALYRACWSLDPPDLGEKLADLFDDEPAILLGHGLCGYRRDRLTLLCLYDLGCRAGELVTLAYCRPS